MECVGEEERGKRREKVKIRKLTMFRRHTLIGSTVLL